MSKSVDERIVQMTFNNKDFEKNVSTTLDSLSKLKKSLDLNGKDFSLNLKDIEAATVGASDGVSGIASATNTATNSFSALKAMAFGVFSRIGQEAYDAGKKIFNFAVTDNITSGWQKYADITTSTKTIMASLTQEFDSEAEKLEFVTNELDRLNWFTDETSYNLVDMVNNIGKFTANNVELENAVDAMQGISTWAAISGQNTEAAGRAMYNLSQALSAGSVKLMDWRSIELANMGTAEFKQAAIESAIAVGTLQRDADGVVSVLGDISQGLDGATSSLKKTSKEAIKVTSENFSTTLSEGWFTSDVLLDVLSKYGKFATRLYEVTEETGSTATEMLKNIDAYMEGTLDIEEAAKQTGQTAEELQKTLEELSSSEYDLGRRAFKASQEARTFKDALNSVRDAVSTQWMNSFKYIFGDPDEATELWTNVANKLYDIFTASGEKRNEMLEEWYEAGGRTSLLDSFEKIYEAISNIKTLASTIFERFFPSLNKNPLLTITEGVAKFADKVSQLFDLTHEHSLVKEVLGEGDIRRTETDYIEWSGTMEKLANVFKAVFGAARLVYDIFKSLAHFSFKSLVSFIGSLSEKVASFENWLIDSGIIGKVGETLTSLGSNFALAIEKIVEALSDLIGKAFKWFKDNKVFEKIGNGIVDFIDTFSKAVIKWSDSIVDWISNSELVKKAGEILGNAISWLSKKISGWYNTIKSWLLGGNLKSLKDGMFSPIIESFNKDAEGMNVFSRAWKNITSGMTWVLDKLPDIWNTIVEFFKQIWGVVSQSETLNKIWSGLKGFFEGAWPAIKTFFSNLWDAFKQMLSIDASRIEDWKERLITKFKPFEKIGDWFKTLGENLSANSRDLKEALSNAWGKVKGFFSSVWDLTKEFFSKIDWKGIFESIDFSGFFKGLKDTIVGAFKSLNNFIPRKELEDGSVIIDIDGLFKRVLGMFAGIASTSFLFNLSGIAGKVGKVFDALRDVIKQIGKGKIFKKDVKDVKKTKPLLDQLGDLFLKIGGSIALIAGSLLALGLLMTPTELRSTADVLKDLFVTLGSVLSIMGLMDLGSKGKISEIGGSMFKLSLSIGIIAGLALAMKKVSWPTLVEGLLKLGSILLLLVGITAIGADISGGKEFKGPLLKISIAVGICAIIVKQISKMHPWAATGGIFALGVIMAELVGAMVVLNKFGGDPKAPILRMSLAISLCAIMFKSLAKLSWKEIGKGILAFTVIVGELAGIMLLMQKFSAGTGKAVAKGIVGMLTAVGGVAASTLIFLYALDKFKNLGLSTWSVLAFTGALDSLMLVSAAINIAYVKLGITPKEAASGLVSSLISLSLPLVVGAILDAIGALGGLTVGENDWTLAEQAESNIERAASLLEKVKEASDLLRSKIIEFNIELDPEGKLSKASFHFEIATSDIWGLVGATGGLKRALAGIAAQSISEVSNLAIDNLKLISYTATSLIADAIAKGFGTDGVTALENAVEQFEKVKEITDILREDVIGLDVEVDPEGKLKTVKGNLNITKSDIWGVVGAIGGIGLALTGILVTDLSKLINDATAGLEVIIFAGLESLADTIFGDSETVSEKLESAKEHIKQVNEIVKELGRRGKILAASAGQAIGGFIGGFAGSVVGTFEGSKEESVTSYLPDIASNLEEAANNFSSGSLDSITNLTTALGGLANTTVSSNSLLQELWYLSDENFKQNLTDLAEGLGSVPSDLDKKAESLKTFTSFLSDISKQETVEGKKYQKVEGSSVIERITDVAKIIDGGLQTDLEKIIDFANLAATVNTEATTGLNNILAFLDSISPVEIETKMSSFIGTIISAITGSSNVEQFSSAGQTMSQAFHDGMMQNGYDYASDVGNSLATETKSGIESVSAWMTGVNFANGFINGMASRRSAARSMGSSLGSSARSGLNGVLAVHSPSRETYKTGTYFVEGFVNAIADHLFEIQNGSKMMADAALGSLDAVGDSVTKMISSSYTPQIHPVVDMTDLSAASGSVDSLLSADGPIDMTVTGYKDFNAGIDSAGDLVSDLSGIAMDNVTVVDAINGLGTKLDMMEEAITNMQLVMDTGVVAGQLAPKMDRTLAARATYKGRGG